MASGIDVNTGDYDRRTPLHLAAANGKAEMIQLLLELGGHSFLAYFPQVIMTLLVLHVITVLSRREG